MLTAESVESMAGRAFRLENAFSPEFRLRNGGGLFAVRILAKDSADRQEISANPIFASNDSPSHAAFLTVNLIYHRICLTQIKLFRFIGFRFV